MNKKLLYPILLLLVSFTRVGYAQDTIPTVKSQSVQHSKSTSIDDPASAPKYTHCIPISSNDLKSQTWYNEITETDIKVQNTFVFTTSSLKQKSMITGALNRTDDLKTQYYLSETEDEKFDYSKVGKPATAGCYLHIRQEDYTGQYCGFLVLGVVEFVSGEKIVLQRGAEVYFTWYAAKYTETSKSISSSIDISKRDSILGEIAYTQIKKEIPQEITRFKYSYQHNSTVEKKVASKDFSPTKNLYVKQGETYYIVTLPHDDWEKDGFDWDYFAKVWILDTGKPYKFRYGLTGIGRGCKKL